ncbi:MAG TPA: DUF488 family protein [Pusillimonas sp.]|uniref:DUF488 domain-containing protein n=1 Tax=Pusillimonas sp. TaxID=3040095 RepID=UPI002B9ED315|nr:DUF488 family protein [Pusillimonas sp.]HUH87520.1 DUF488 family protein [Pusillimonas sp.]
MKVKVDIKRAYEAPSGHDGFRILVDRMWPRGVKKDDLPFDLWCKQLAPSPALRKWFGHKPERWERFRAEYQKELHTAEQAQRLREVLKHADSSHITLLYGARDTEHNHAVILADEITRTARPLRKPADKAAVSA